MENKRISFGYEDTDKSIEMELYGIVFKIEDLGSIEEIENMDTSNQEVMETYLEGILGNGAIERINNKRIKDGYKELDLNIELNILGCIFETYAKSATGNVLGRVTKAVEDINKDVNNLNNREQRRNYRKNRNYYNRNRRRY